jgi:hypothetical protein
LEWSKRSRWCWREIQNGEERRLFRPLHAEKAVGQMKRRKEKERWMLVVEKDQNEEGWCELGQCM